MPNSSMKIKYDEGSKVDKVNLAELERQSQLDENSFEDNPSINADINNKNIKTLLQDAENRIEKEQERKDANTDQQMREAAEKHFRRDLNEGGSMLMPPEREEYGMGALVKATTKAAQKAQKLWKDRNEPVKKTRRPHRSSEQIQADGERKDYQRGLSTDFFFDAPESDKLRKLKASQIPEGTPKFRKAFKKAWKAKEDTFMSEGKEYKVEDLIQEGTQVYKSSFNEGGKMKYAEGSMLVPPEMEMGIEEQEQDMPVDTYDNIPPDEMAAAEASQLPDEQMEDEHLEYVLDEALDPEDQEYLMGVLETDERLSNIFDKVMDVAAEFSGEGEVDGPGTGVSDSIPARLSDGEFVVTEKATDQIGADNLQTMMDDAEQAYDGGYMKKAFGGLTLDPMDNEKSYGVEQMNETQNELRKQMLGANRMPSVLK